MAYIVLHYKWDDSRTIERSRFEYWYQAQQFIDKIGYRYISYIAERDNGCSCIDKDNESHAACRIHGISAQLSRTQME